jgi:hypothetical protein
LSITGNLIIEPAQAGIYVAEHLENGAALPSSDFVVSANTIVSPGVRDGGSGYGVYAERASGGVIAGNEIDQPRTHGIALEECDGVAIAANTVRGPGVGSGVLLSRSQHVAVGANALCDSVHGEGMLVEDLSAPASSDVAIAQNVVSGNSGGIRVAAGAAGRFVVVGNAIGGNEGPAVSLDGAAGKTAANVSETATTVASAPTLTVSRDLSLVTVTGRNTVRALSDDSAEAGRVLALRFSDGCLVTTGGNIVMPRSFAAPENGMLVLVCDGAKWYESTRSTPAG